jgi:hypothetical protein
VTKVDLATGFVLGAILYPFRALAYGAFRDCSEDRLAGHLLGLQWSPPLLFTGIFWMFGRRAGFSFYKSEGALYLYAESSG